MHGKHFSFFFFLFTWILSGNLYAEKPKSYVQPSLISSVKSFVPGQNFKVGVLFKIDPEWHIYWINPGDAGIPTKVKWKTVPEIQMEPFTLPTPEKFITPSVVSYGYEKEVVFIYKVTPPQSSQLELMANVSWLACKELCIPGKATVSLTLDASSQVTANVENSELIRKYEAQIPGESRGFSLSAGYSDQYTLVTVKADSEISVITPLYFFPIRSDLFIHDPELKFRKTQEGFEFLLKRSKIVREPIEKVEGILVFDQNHRHESIQVSVKANKSPIPKF